VSGALYQWFYCINLIGGNYYEFQWKSSRNRRKSKEL
jgi:hypothetical protein